MKTKLTLAALTAAFSLNIASAQDGAVDFEKQILPILKESCFKCHEKDERKRRRRQA